VVTLCCRKTELMGSSALLGDRRVKECRALNLAHGTRAMLVSRTLRTAHLIRGYLANLRRISPRAASPSGARTAAGISGMTSFRF